MKLKRFVAPDTRTAMQQVKATFGPDAVILSSSKVDGGVEVVAAIDFDESIISSKAAVSVAEPAPAINQPEKPSALDDMRQQIDTLRGMLETQMQGFGTEGSPLARLLNQKLFSLGVSQLSASRWTKVIPSHLSQLQAWQQLTQLISKQIPIQDNRRIEEGGIYAFVGPTGVGKTTTLAKIAARFALRYGADKLGLVTMDTYRIAAQEQLVMYGKILGVNVCIAEDKVALLRVLRQLSDKKLILIDTAGMNPADIRVGEQMNTLSEQLQSINTVLVLPATSHYQVLIQAIRQFGEDKIDQCIITKLDECMAIGGVISALSETGRPVSYLTHGQRVPEDIKMATRHQLIDVLIQQDEFICKSQRSMEQDWQQAFRRVDYVEG